MKKGIALLLALILVLGLVACAAKTQPTTPEEDATPTEETTPPANEENVAPDETAEDQEPVTLSVWFYNDPGAEEIYKKFSAAVNAQYPWITVEYEVLPYDSGPEKFTVACATGTTPDIYFDGYSRIAPAVNAGLTMDLTEVAQSNQNVFMGEQKDGIVDGKYNFIATATGAAYGVFVNMDLANELGVADLLPEDKLTWSYDEYLEFCRAAKAADASVIPQALFAGSRSSDAWYYSWFIGNGVELTNDELTATAFNIGENREKAISTLNVYRTLIDEGLANDGCAAMTDQDCEQLWCAGKLLLLANSLNCATYYQSLQDEGTSMEFTFDVLGLPTAEGKEIPTSACWGSYGFCAFKNNGHDEAIKLALNVWLQNPEYQKELCLSTGFMPVMNTVEIDWGSEHIGEIMDFVTEYTAAHTVSSFGILENWWTDFRETLYPQLQDFYVGNIDAGTVLDNWQAAGDQVIKNAN